MSPPPLELPSQELFLGRYQELVDRRLAAWDEERTGSRLWARDHELWSAEPLPELTDRLGWLTLPETMAAELAGIRELAAEVAAEGCRRVVVLGMGGSSLAPEVFQRCLGSRPGFPALTVLDSTHPGSVAAAAAALDAEKTLFIVASKSGGTLETLSLFRYFWQFVGERVAEPGRRFVAITDPGSSLEELARDRRFRRTFRADPEVGGRFSALTPFGLVPAALIGQDPGRLLAAAAAMAAACGADRHAWESPGLILGAALGELARAGRDKLTFVTSPGLAALPDWIEQLVAESTGKDEQGIVPVVGEPPGRPEDYGSDRVFAALDLLGDAGKAAGESHLGLLDELESAGHPVIRIGLSRPEALAAEMFRWEVATAAAGIVLGIHPFNQPDVQVAKELAKRAMAGSGAAAAIDLPIDVDDTETMKAAVEELLAAASQGDYVAVQAYVQGTQAAGQRLAGIQLAIRERTGLAATVGYGPRFLHSTGQLHKGGPDSGLFLQLIDRPAGDVPVPETDFTFGRLIRAQADGDAGALRQRRRRLVRIDMGSRAESGLERLGRVLSD